MNKTTKKKRPAPKQLRLKDDFTLWLEVDFGQNLPWIDDPSCQKKGALLDLASSVRTKALAASRLIESVKSVTHAWSALVPHVQQQRGSEVEDFCPEWHCDPRFAVKNNGESKKKDGLRLIHGICSTIHLSSSSLHNDDLLLLPLLLKQDAFAFRSLSAATVYVTLTHYSAEKHEITPLLGWRLDTKDFTFVPAFSPRFADKEPLEKESAE